LCRNCLLQQVIEGKVKGGIEVTRRRERRRKKLLDDLKDRRGYSHLEEEAVDRTVWRAGFGRGFGPVVRQTDKWMDFFIFDKIFYPLCVFMELINKIKTFSNPLLNIMLFCCRVLQRKCV
jgi:hypothetical protein